MDRWKWQPKEEEDKKKEPGSRECSNTERDTAVVKLFIQNRPSFTFKSHKREDGQKAADKKVTKFHK